MTAIMQVVFLAAAAWSLWEGNTEGFWACLIIVHVWIAASWLRRAA